MTNFRDALQISLLCCSMSILGVIRSIANKTVVSSLPFPITCTMVTLVSMSVYSMLWTQCRNGTPNLRNINNKYWLSVFVPVGFLKAATILSSFTALWFVPVSFMYTVKTAMPLFSAVWAWIILGEVETISVYASLLPLAGGIVLTVLTEHTFSFVGMIGAFTSCAMYAAFNILIKKILVDTKIDRLPLLGALALIGALALFPFWLYVDSVTLYRTYVASESVPVMPTTTATILNAPDWQKWPLVFACGLFSFLQYATTYALITKLGGLSFSVANTVKLVMVITISILVLRNPVSRLNVVGMLTSVIGVTLYRYVKLKSAPKRKTSIADTSPVEIT